jgi:peptidoglycan/LPS O-acetylase OafA/YrhL
MNLASPTGPLQVPSVSASSPQAPVSPAHAPDGYRPALDGIRAIAVLSVFIYHLQAPWLRGGFLGVDIFFVLSGYLITGLLVAEHAATGRISVPRFLARRARRLLPAVLLLLLSVAFAVYTFKPVTEWMARGEDLRWALFYGANWHQIATSQDYFARWISASPLRHLWSIAIEEQFYIVWPVLMMLGLAARARRWLLPAIVTGAIASAAAMLWLYNPASPTRAYVGTDTRVQELLVGAALAIAMHRHRARMTVVTRTRAAVAALGFCGVLLALIALPDSSPLYYRGGALLISLAVAGTIWLVEVMPRGVLGRVLGQGVLTWIGRISYGLYLWHWPIILFVPSLLVRLYGGRGMVMADQPVTRIGLIVALTLLFTVVSYYAIERPIRHGSLGRRLTPPDVAMASAVAITVVFIAMDVRLAVPYKLLRQITQGKGSCPLGQPSCLVVEGGPGRPVVVVMGDSVPWTMVPAFETLSRKHSWTLVSAAQNGCSIISHAMVAGNPTCLPRIPVIEREVLSYNPTLIFVSDYHLPNSSYDEAGTLLPRTSPAHVAEMERLLNRWAERMTATGAQLVLMRYTNESPMLDAPMCLEPRNANQPFCHTPAVGRYEVYNAMLDRIASRHPDRVRTIDLTGELCPGNYCKSLVDGLLVRHDGMHYSLEGNRWLVPHLERKLANAGVALTL